MSIPKLIPNILILKLFTCPRVLPRLCSIWPLTFRSKWVRDFRGTLRTFADKLRQTFAWRPKIFRAKTSTVQFALSVPSICRKTFCLERRRNVPESDCLERCRKCEQDKRCHLGEKKEFELHLGIKRILKRVQNNILTGFMMRVQTRLFKRSYFSFTVSYFIDSEKDWTTELKRETYRIVDILWRVWYLPWVNGERVKTKLFVRLACKVRGWDRTKPGEKKAIL